eukprot:TRINITY_DN27062_c0_g1_i1.p1 TRINITY_DN27062_c0_g1~~TRINITY_DN27062_c0_g1_i1.p1  ORF type:complete len:215 (+),score=23.62 TRINITY_DN27062_c0_g1_i1:75-647(+)
MAVGYDPVQRGLQWRRRVDREELTLCNKSLSRAAHHSLYSSGASTRLELLQQTLLNSNGANRAQPIRSVPGTPRQVTPRGATPHFLTPRQQTPSVDRRPGSVGGFSVGSRSSMHSNLSKFTENSALKLELLEETRRRQAAEAELDRLQQVVASSWGSAPPGSSGALTPLHESFDKGAFDFTPPLQGSYRL